MLDEKKYFQEMQTPSITPLPTLGYMASHVAVNRLIQSHHHLIFFVNGLTCNQKVEEAANPALTARDRETLTFAQFIGDMPRALVDMTEQLDDTIVRLKTLIYGE